MNDLSHQNHIAASQESGRPEYVPPPVRVMSEAEVLSAFQTTAAAGTGTIVWWVM